MKGRTPTAEERRWMSRIQEFGCCVCRKVFGVLTPAEIHHIDGKTKVDAHLKSIPLCYHHHRSGVDSEQVTSRHPFKGRFEDRYGSQLELLEWVRERINEDDRAAPTTTESHPAWRAEGE